MTDDGAVLRDIVHPNWCRVGHGNNDDHGPVPDWYVNQRMIEHHLEVLRRVQALELRASTRRWPLALSYSTRMALGAGISVMMAYGGLLGLVLHCTGRF